MTSRYDIAGRVIVEMTADQAARWNAGEMEDEEMDALHATIAGDDDATVDTTIGGLIADGMIAAQDLVGEPANLMEQMS